MKLSIIMPCYNEEKTVGEILERVGKVEVNGVSKEIIFVDDGSTDDTFKIVSKLKGGIKGLNIVRHRKNRGKGSAIQTGLKHITGDIIIIQDADLEYDPRDIPRLIEPIIDGKSNAVYGTRLRMKPVFFGENKTPFLLNFFGNRFLSLITSILYGQQITDMETGYKAFSKKALNGIKLNTHSFDFEPEITSKILKRGTKILEVDIKTKPRGYLEGKKIRAFRDGLIALWALIKYKFID